MQSRSESFPTASQAAVLLLAGFLLQYLVGVALYDARHVLGLSLEQLDAFVMLLANGLVLAAVTHYRGMSYRDLVHPSRSSAWVTATLLIPPTLMLVPLVFLLDRALTTAVESVLPLSQWEQQAFSSMVDGSMAAVVATCLLAPILEEMLFRGVLLRSFLMQYPRWAAISYSALFFGVAHLNIYQFLLAFLLGLLLGWPFERSRSLLPCIALHAALNSWVVFAETASAGEANRGVLGTPAAAWVFSLAAAGVGALLLRRFLFARPGMGGTKAI